MVGLVFSPQPDAMPIVVEVPQLLAAEDYYVAYSCMPMVLTPLSQITDKRVVLFTKDVCKWEEYFADRPNVSVRKVGASFLDVLSRSSGLIASPSPGVVMQALGCGKPCYLMCPPGHLEQACNENYYFRHFIGVAGPATESINSWAAHAMGSANTAPMLAQAARVREWLNQFDSQAEVTLVGRLRELSAAALVTQFQ